MGQKRGLGRQATKEYNLGKYLTKVGIKHFSYNKQKNLIRVTYDDGNQELIHNL